MDLAKLISTWSKDPDVQVGCVIVGPDREVRSVGYNGLPRGVNDEIEERLTRPGKDDWFEHAERNAIFNSSRMGVALLGCTAYVNGVHGFPCGPCARAFVQCGIKRLVGLPPDMSNEKYAKSYSNTMKMFQEAGVAFSSIS
jgi:dCMP deaminase